MEGLLNYATLFSCFLPPSFSHHLQIIQLNLCIVLDNMRDIY